MMSMPWALPGMAKTKLKKNSKSNFSQEIRIKRKTELPPFYFSVFPKLSKSDPNRGWSITNSSLGTPWQGLQNSMGPGRWVWGVLAPCPGTLTSGYAWHRHRLPLVPPLPHYPVYCILLMEKWRGFPEYICWQCLLPRQSRCLCSSRISPNGCRR